MLYDVYAQAEAYTHTGLVRATKCLSPCNLKVQRKMEPIKLNHNHKSYAQALLYQHSGGCERGKMEDKIGKVLHCDAQLRFYEN